MTDKTRSGPAHEIRAGVVELATGRMTARERLAMSWLDAGPMRYPDRSREALCEGRREEPILGRLQP